MYAQLCLRLSKEAPNFEPPDKKTCTFSKLLINTCRDRFLNRSTLSKTNLDNITTSSVNYYNTESSGNGTNSSERSTGSGANNGGLGSGFAAESNGIDDQDEEERKHIAKQRMLGNIKFIGELHKLGLCRPNTLHNCILQLLEKTSSKNDMVRRATLDDRCEDLECLCELIRTCGKNLDSEQGKGLMNQYFRQMEKRSQSTEYPNRIRFMLRDVIELRRSDWIPRKVATTDGPVPIQQLRNEEEILIRPSFPYRNHRNDGRNSDPDHWMNKSPLNLQSSGYHDVLGGLSVSSSSHIIPPYGQGSNSYLNRNDNRGDDMGGGRMGSKTMINSRDRDNNSRDGGNSYRHNNHRGNQNHNHNNYNNRYSKHNNHSHGGNNSYGNNNTATSMGGSKELAPRFKRTMIAPQQQQQQDPVENLLFRPPAGSLLFAANTANLNNLPISQQQRPHSASATENGYLGNHQQQSTHSYPNSGRGNAVQSSATNGNNPNHIHGSKDWPTPNGAVNNGNNQGIGKDSSATTNASNKQNATAAATQPEKPAKVKKDKGPGKDEILKKVTTFLNERLIQNAATIVDSNITDDEKVDIIDGEKHETIDTIVHSFLELKVPEKCMRDAITILLNEMFERHDAVLEKRTIEFLCCLKRENKLNTNATLDAFKAVINGMGESNVPRITTLVAQLLASAVTVKLCKLSDIASYTENGQHYPLLLLVLQQLYKMLGKPALVELFNASKVNLMASLPEADRNKERMAAILEDRNLSFLYPLLKVQSELQKQLMADPNPQQFYKWIKDNVEAECFTEPGFVTALVTVLMKYITQETTLAEGVDITKVVEKSMVEKEKAVLEKYCPVLNAFLTGKQNLQLIAVYALQVFCNSVGFPKGMLLRWFTALYDLNVIEEDSFLLWKEDISDAYPGKGQALFQVNTWLTWLEQAESEEDEDDE